MTVAGQSPPPEWGKDELTKFLDQARGNQFATFVHKPVARDLIGIDACFQRIEQGWINPRPWFTALFMYRAHSAYRAAFGAAMAGQTFEVFPLVRSCLECGAYGLHVGSDSNRAEIWLRRHDDANAKKCMRNEFLISRLRETIKKHSKKMANLFDELYERTVDFGGHPNEHALLGNMLREADMDRIEFQTVFLHKDGVQMDHALKTTGQVGLWALHAFQLLYRERFMLLGVNESLEEIRNRF